MNSKSNEFEEHVKAWVKLDTSIRELNSRSKALRDSRSELEGKITSFVETNNMEGTTIRINDGNHSGALGFHEQKTTQPITMKLVRSCLDDLISDPECVEAIMDHIKESRAQKTNLNIKRTFE